MAARNQLRSGIACAVTALALAPLSPRAPLAHFAPLTPLAPLPPNPLVAERVAAVSEDELAASLERLVGFHTRHTNSSTASPTHGIGAARDWIHSHFAEVGADSAAGLEARFFDFRQTVCGIEGEHRNVVATIPGTKTPDRHLVLLAHMDSRTRDRCDATSFAPGANDDGSGTAVILEVARLLADVPLESTVVIQAVTGEEQGLFGSTAWAQVAEVQALRLDAVITNDVVGNTTGCVDPACPPGEPRITDRDSIRHFADGPETSNHRQLARSNALQVERYVEGFTVTLVESRDRPGRGGDHIPFSTRGWASTRFTEPHEDGDGSGRNGRQHNEFDTLDGVDIGYVARVARLNAAIVLNWALAPEPPATPEVIALADGTIEVSWAPVTSADDVAGYRVAIRGEGEADFERILDAGWSPGAPARRVVDGLVDGRAVWVSVSAYDADGNESVFSQESRAVPELVATRTPLPLSSPSLSPSSTPTASSPPTTIASPTPTLTPTPSPSPTPAPVYLPWSVANEPPSDAADGDGAGAANTAIAAVSRAVLSIARRIAGRLGIGEALRGEGDAAGVVEGNGAGHGELLASGLAVLDRESQSASGEPYLSITIPR